jgi:phage tail-like protein
MLDSNGTRHQLVLGRGDWVRLALPAQAGAVPAQPTGSPSVSAGAGPWENTDFDRTGNQLSLARLPMAAAQWPSGQAPTGGTRRAAAADANGNIYWIDPTETAILVQAAADGSRSTFWSQARSGTQPPTTPIATEPSAASGAPASTPGGFGPVTAPTGGGTPGTLRGLTVTSEEYLVVGSVAPAGLFVFDLRSSTPPLQMLWPVSLDCSIVQLWATPDGGLLALDVSPDQPRYWRLNRVFNVVSSVSSPTPTPEAGAFAPATPASSADVTVPRPSPGQAVPLAGTPLAVAQLPSGTVVVVGQDPTDEASTVRVYRDDAFGGQQLTLGEDDAGNPIVAADMTLGPAGTGEPADVVGHLYVVSATRQEAHDFVVTEVAGVASIRRAARQLPLRGYGDGGLAIAAGGPIYDSGGHWVPLASQPQSRFATSATVVVGPFDGGQPGCVWHRLMLDAVVPPRCAVAISSRAADDPTTLTLAPFQPEPPPSVRPDGSEEPYADLPSPYTTSETLFQTAQGRWLDVQLTLTGDGRTTPKLRALRIYYPRFSYLHNYLPAVYRADPASASFLDRFLANVEGINTNIEDLIAYAQMLFDPRSTPDGALDWLAGFFDVALDPAWTDAKRRMFVAHAVDFFGWRGTIRGLQIAVRLALDPTVDESLFTSPADPQTLAYRVVELFNNPVVGDLSAPGSSSPPAPMVVAGAPEAPTLPPSDTPAGVAAQDQTQWQQFLSLRYQRLSALNAAYGVSTPYASFSDVPLNATAPAGGAALSDWLDFTTVVAPATGQAHRFILLVPLALSAASDPTNPDPGGLRALARRIVELNKPSHTACDIQYYWSAFQVGGAQLGNSTAIDVGSRAPQLLVPAQLGRDYAGASYLGGASAPYLTAGPSIGRDTTLDS